MDYRLGPPREPKPLPKKYGWYRDYHDDILQPKWRLVSARAGVPLPHVHCVIRALRCAASRARKSGSVEGFDAHECEVSTGVPAADVVKVMQQLEQDGWFTQDHIVTWLDEQPEQEDPTAVLRKRNQRLRDKAKIAATMGRATPEQLALLSVAERSVAERLVELSRVTAPAEPEPKPQPVLPFMAVVSAYDTPDYRAQAAEQNDRAARVWLFGDGRGLVSYGIASRLVADNYGLTRLNADLSIRHWLEGMANDVVMLATIISNAYEQALNGDGFRAVIEQRMAEVIRERTAGPTLPFGIAAQKGGRGA